MSRLILLALLLLLAFGFIRAASNDETSPIVVSGE